MTVSKGIHSNGRKNGVPFGGGASSPPVFPPDFPPNLATPALKLVYEKKLTVAVKKRRTVGGRRVLPTGDTTRFPARFGAASAAARCHGRAAHSDAVGGGVAGGRGATGFTLVERASVHARKRESLKLATPPPIYTYTYT